MYDIIIIGAGPAGMTAAIYAANNKIKTLVIAKESPKETADSLGLLKFKDLKKSFDNELKENSEFLEFQNKEVTALEKNVVSFSLELKNGTLHYSKCIIIAVGNAETTFDLITHKDNEGRVKVDGKMKTNIPGIFAAGNATNAGAQDILVSSGQGAQAALGALNYINK